MKKNKISRIANRIAFILVGVVAVVLIVAAILRTPVLLWIALGIWIIDLMLLIITNRCPSCGKFFPGIYWAKSAGVCKSCGKAITFDDEMSE